MLARILHYPALIEEPDPKKFCEGEFWDGDLTQSFYVWEGVHTIDLVTFHQLSKPLRPARSVSVPFREEGLPTGTVVKPCKVEGCQFAFSLLDAKHVDLVFASADALIDLCRLLIAERENAVPHAKAELKDHAKLRFREGNSELLDFVARFPEDAKPWGLPPSK